MYKLVPITLVGILLSSCGTEPTVEQSNTMTTEVETNTPLASASTLPFKAPPFDQLNNDVYQPAIDAGMSKHLQEIEAIRDNSGSATFENTIVALERSGQDLGRVLSVFYELTSSNTNDTLQDIKGEIAPRLSAHNDAISLDPVLFGRIKAVYDALPALGLDPVSQRLVQRYYTRYVRSGALLSDEDKQKLKGLNETMSELSTTFSNNVLEEVKASAVLVDDVKQLNGLSDDQIAAAAEAATGKGHNGKWLIALRNTTQQPALVSLTNRALRERIYKTSVARNAQDNEFDNRKVIRQIAQLRAEKAQLFGFPNWASYVMDDQMAKTPDAALGLLTRLAPAAAKNAKAEAAMLQAMINEQGGDFTLEPWDWDFYAEQVRKAEYDLDESAIKPYFEFETVLQNGVLYAANKLYGLTFNERTDLPVYHPDVRVFDIIGPGGKQIGLFYGDYYARDNKRGGAWMNSFVDQSTLLENAPVVTQNCNYVKPAAGKPCLLSFDDVTTLFHEFGHAIHGMLSEQKYPYFSGTATSRDFVEYPSQINENWVLEPEVFSNFAKHYETGESMPAELVEKIRKSSKFNQGYGTSEYLAACLIDQEWHNRSVDAPEVEDVEAFEKAALKKYGLDDPRVPPRYKTCYFSHSWGGYSANYYAYIWAEVMDADTYAWFKANGGMTRENGEKLRLAILSVGGSVDENEMFRNLTGRDPNVEPLLEKRGLN